MAQSDSDSSPVVPQGPANIGNAQDEYGTNGTSRFGSGSRVKYYREVQVIEFFVGTRCLKLLKLAVG
jgi:hypothetical protein